MPTVWRLLLVLLLWPSPRTAAEPAWRVCMDTDLAPWSFIPSRLPRFDEDPAKSTRLAPATPAEIKTAVGIDVDVAQLVAKRLGASLQIVQTPWGQLESALLAGHCDAILNAWRATRRTPGAIVFSERYLDWRLQVAAHKDDTRFRSFTDLAGRTVGYTDESAIEQSRDALPGAKLVPFELNRSLFYALQTRKIDAVAHDSTYIAWRIGRGDPFRTVGEPLNTLSYYVGVPMKHESTEQVLGAMRDLATSRELVAVQMRWRASGR